jgi:tRNA U34 5-methylaminomethyl-2-thiouridine-forming methyltransferase MnmC
MKPEEQQSHLQIVTTADGSNTIYNAQVGENYHSKHGALQESRHVFLQSGLEYFLEHSNGVNDSVSILEVGFGTGLNYLLTADYCLTQQIKLHYTGIEAYPLTAAMLGATGYEQYVAATTWTSFLTAYQQALTEVVRVGDYVELQVNSLILNQKGYLT